MKPIEELVTQSLQIAEDRIKGLMPLDIQAAIQKILEDQKAQTQKCSPELQALKDLWSWDREERPSLAQQEKLIIQTTNAAHAYFKEKHKLDIAVLREKKRRNNNVTISGDDIEVVGTPEVEAAEMQNNRKDGYHEFGIFTRNLIDQIRLSGERDAVLKDEAVKTNMGLFCEYLAQLDARTTEEQKLYFRRFPPRDPEDYQCIGGTGTRVQNELNTLKSTAESKDILDIHLGLSAQITEKMTNQIQLGNQIHAAPYFLCALGLEHAKEIEKRDPVFTIARTGLTPSLMRSYIREYASSFKEALSQDISNKREEFTQRAKTIKEVIDKYSNITSVLRNDEEAEKLYEALKHLGIAPEKIFSYVDEGEEEVKGDDGDKTVKFSIYEWNEDGIAAAIADLPSLNLLPKETRQASSLQDLLDRDTNTNPTRIIFGSFEHHEITSLLKSENRDELFLGMQELWLAGERFLINDPIKFIKIIHSLEPKNESDSHAQYKEKIKVKFEQIKEKLPSNHHHKIERILEQYDEHIRNLNPILKSKIFEDIMVDGNIWRDLISDKSLVSEELFRDNELLQKVICRKNDPIVVQAILDAGAKKFINEKVPGCQQDQFYTPLHTAATENKPEIMKILCRNGANPNINLNVAHPLSPIKPEPDTLLQSLCYQESNLAMVKVLLEEGNADPNITAYNSSPLFKAASNNCPLLVEALCDAGADLDRKSFQALGYRSALDVAIQRGHQESVKMLLKKGATYTPRAGFISEVNNSMMDYSERTFARDLQSRGYQYNPVSYQSHEADEIISDYVFFHKLSSAITGSIANPDKKSRKDLAILSHKICTKLINLYDLNKRAIKGVLAFEEGQDIDISTNENLKYLSQAVIDKIELRNRKICFGMERNSLELRDNLTAEILNIFDSEARISDAIEEGRLSFEAKKEENQIFDPSTKRKPTTRSTKPASIVPLGNVITDRNRDEISPQEVVVR